MANRLNINKTHRGGFTVCHKQNTGLTVCHKQNTPWRFHGSPKRNHHQAPTGLIFYGNGVAAFGEVVHEYLFHSV